MDNQWTNGRARHVLVLFRSLDESRAREPKKGYDPFLMIASSQKGVVPLFRSGNASAALADHHATIASSKSAASSSGPAGRGDSFVTRCCGNVPSTRPAMSAEV